MPEQTESATVTLNTKNLVATTAVVTATVIVTTGTLRVAAGVVYPSLHKLTRRLERKSEELKNSK